MRPPRCAAAAGETEPPLGLTRPAKDVVVVVVAVAGAELPPTAEALAGPSEGVVRKTELDDDEAARDRWEARGVSSTSPAVTFLNLSWRGRLSLPPGERTLDRGEATLELEGDAALATPPVEMAAGTFFLETASAGALSLVDVEGGTARLRGSGSSASMR